MDLYTARKLHSAIEKYLLLTNKRDVFITVGYLLSSQPVRTRIYVLKLQRARYYEHNVFHHPSFPPKLTYTGHWHKALRYFPINK